MDAVDSLPQGVVTFFVAYEYLALVALFFISEAGVPLPLPNFALILYASYLSGQGQGNLLLILLSVVVGMLAGSLVLYLAASRGGRPLLQKYGKVHQTQSGKARPRRVVVPQARPAGHRARVSHTRNQISDSRRCRSVPSPPSYLSLLCGDISDRVDLFLHLPGSCLRKRVRYGHRQLEKPVSRGRCRGSGTDSDSRAGGEASGEREGEGRGSC